MADGFYNINNEYITKESIINTLIEFYNEKYDGNTTKINDFNEGSEIRNLLEAMAVLAYNILEELNETLKNHFINTAEGEYLDLLGANPNVNLEREQGAAATGLVKFTYPAQATTEMNIPAGVTVSSTKNGLEYITTSEGYILVGENYTYIPVECEYTGTDGNCAIGDIDTCEFAEFTVTNEEPIEGGLDYEEDEEYRKRLLDFIQADNFGAIGYYENVILNRGDVHDLTTVVNGNIIKFVLNCNADINASSETILDVIDYFNGNNTRVVGHTLNIIPSNIHTVSFTITVPSTCGYSEDTIKDFFSCYFNGGAMQEFPIMYDGLKIGEQVSSNSLITELTTNLTDISSASISNIVNKIGNVTTSSFNFYVTENASYYLNNLNVVFQ